MMTQNTTPTTTTTTINRDLMIQWLRRLLRVRVRSSSLPVLQMIRIRSAEGRWLLAATDLNVWQEVEVPLAPDLPEDLLVNGSRLLSAVECIPGEEVMVASRAGSLSLSGEGVRYELATLSSSEFPVLEASCDQWSDLVEAPGELLAQALGRVSFSAARDGARAALCGVHVCSEGESLRMVATDGHRLSVAGLPCDPPAVKLTVPLAAALILEKMCRDAGEEAVKLSASPTRLVARSGGWTFSSNLVDFNFPPWRKVVPEAGAISPVRIQARAWEAALRRCLAVGGSSKTVSIASGRMVMENPASARAECDLPGLEVPPCALNAEYLLEALCACPGEEAELLQCDALSPLLLRNVEASEGLGAGEWMHVLMPVRKN